MRKCTVYDFICLERWSIFHGAKFKLARVFANYGNIRFIIPKYFKTGTTGWPVLKTGRLFWSFQSLGPTIFRSLVC